jgi:hypothetical protein
MSRNGFHAVAEAGAHFLAQASAGRPTLDKSVKPARRQVARLSLLDYNKPHIFLIIFW